jgi:molybdenum cofactor cytidylyltransferase
MVQHSTPLSLSNVKATALLPSEPVAAGTGAVILAAGASLRMGAPKALLPWNGTNLLQYALQQARAAAVDDIVVVLGPAMGDLEGSLGDVRVAFNAIPETGRSASIRVGTEAMSDKVSALLIQSVDQPCPVEVLIALFAAIARRAGEIAVPSYNGRRGHPVCFAGSLLPELRAITEEGEGLRSVVRRHAQHLVEVPVNSPSVLWNLNDPAAYAAAQAHAE